MIYRYVPLNKPIRQGDIFKELSFVRFNLNNLCTFQDDNAIISTK